MIFVGVDPSSKYVGISVIEVDDVDYTIKNIEVSLLDLTLRRNNTRQDDVTWRLFDLKNRFRTLLENHDVDVLVLEAGYIDTRKPAAYAPLAQSTMLMRHLAMELDVNFELYMITPNEAKKTIGLKKIKERPEMTSKDLVLHYIQLSEELKDLMDYETKTEHEVDAVIIAYKKILDYRSKHVRTDKQTK